MTDGIEHFADLLVVSFVKRDFIPAVFVGGFEFLDGCGRGFEAVFKTHTAPQFERAIETEFSAGHIKLIADCAKLLVPGRSRLVLTAYAIRASALSLDCLVRETLGGRPGVQSVGELALAEEWGDRLIGTSLYVRFEGLDG